jgi:hypothetical protein
MNLWNDAKRKEFCKEYILTCRIFDKEISYDLAQMVANDLADLDPNKCIFALASYRMNSFNKFWPKSVDIRGIINPQPSERDIAVALARKIELAVAKRGYYWPQGICVGQDQDGKPVMNYEGENGQLFSTFKAAAISQLGDIGWHLLCSRGGWQNIHQSANEMEEGQFIAQLRDQVESTLKLQKAGVDLTQISMPSAQKELAPANVISLITKKNEMVTT